MDPKRLLTKKKKTILAIVFLLIVVAGLSFFFYQRIKNKQNNILSNNKSISFPAQVIKSNATRFFIDINSTVFDSITARIKYKNPSSVPKEIKLGVRGSEKDKYLYQIFYQRLLQNCNWASITERNNTLYQKNKNYNSLSELASNPPYKDKIALYNSDWQVPLRGIEQTSIKNLKKEVELRGTHTFVVKVDKLPFIFKLSKQDINAANGEDKYLISISKNSKIIEEKTIEDDGFTGKERLKKEPQSVEFKLDKIDIGVYEILAKFEGTGTDSIITSVETNQAKMVIKNNIYLLENKPRVLYASNLPLVLKVPSKDYLQTINLNDDTPLKIEKETEKYTFDLPQLSPGNNLHKLEIPSPHLYLISTGYFAFSAEEYFDPKAPLSGIDLNTLISLDEIDYLLTSIPKARQEGEWLINEITIDGKDIKIDENKKLYFSLEIPDLQKESGELEIESFDIGVKIPWLLGNKLNRGNVTVSPTPTPKVISPVSGNIPTVKPTPIPTTVGKSIKIRVLNAGSPAGYAKKYADLIIAAGYLNVEIENAEGEKIKDATIVYPKALETDIGKIEQILKNEYKNINKVVNNDKTEIIISIGALFVNVTPTITP